MTEGGQVSAGTLPEKEVIAFNDELLRKGHSPLTVASYLVTLRKFYAWTEANRLYPNIARNIKNPRHGKGFLKLHLDDGEVRDLLAWASERTPRDRAIITLLLCTGLRTVEVQRARIEDLTIRRGRRVLLVQGKGHNAKDSFVVLNA